MNLIVLTAVLSCLNSGVYVASNLFTSSAWGNSGDFSYDVGAAVVSPSGGTALTDRVGGRGISFNYNRSQNYVSYGYPAAPPFTGERLWTCNSPLQTSGNSASPARTHSVPRSAA